MTKIAIDGRAPNAEVLMRYLFAFFVVCFFAAPALAEYKKWETNGRWCQIVKDFPPPRSPGEPLAGELPGDPQLSASKDGSVRVFIDNEEIRDLEKALHNLKICDKFWTCVAQRDGDEEPPKGKRRPKHCYESMWKGWRE
jgi:hypothetical protein